MILFIDTEFADVTASELVSLALVSDCGRYEFYAERDPLPSSPTDFVRSVVYPLLERGERALPDPRFTEALHAFFAYVRVAARYGRIVVAFDYRADVDLLNYALDGFEAIETPARPDFGQFNLGLLGGQYVHAVEQLFARTPAVCAKRHNAHTDASVNRDAYVLLKAFEDLRTADPELAQLATDALGPSKVAFWWSDASRRLGGRKPCEALAAGQRAEVWQLVADIRFGNPA